MLHRSSCQPLFLAHLDNAPFVAERFTEARRLIGEHTTSRYPDRRVASVCPPPHFYGRNYPVVPGSCCIDYVLSAELDEQMTHSAPTVARLKVSNKLCNHVLALSVCVRAFKTHFVVQETFVRLWGILLFPRDNVSVVRRSFVLFIIFSEQRISTGDGECNSL